MRISWVTEDLRAQQVLGTAHYLKPLTDMWGSTERIAFRNCPGRWGGVEAGARQAGPDGAVSSAPLEGGSKPGLKDRYTR